MASKQLCNQKTYSRRKRVTGGKKCTASARSNAVRTGKVFSPFRIFSDPSSSEDPDDVIPLPEKPSKVPTRKRKTVTAEESTEVTDFVYEPKLFEEMPEVVPVKRTRRGQAAKSRGVSDVSNIQRSEENRMPKTRKREKQNVTAIKCQMQSDWIEPDLGDLSIELSGKRQKKKTAKNSQIDTNSDKVKKNVKKKNDFARPRLLVQRSSVHDGAKKSKVKSVQSIGGDSTALSEADILKNVNFSPDPSFKEQFVKSWVGESVEALESGELVQWSDEQTLQSSQKNDSACPSLTQSGIALQPKNKLNVDVAGCSNLQGAPNRKAKNSITRVGDNTSVECASKILSSECTVQSLKSPNVPRKTGQIKSGSKAVMSLVLSTSTNSIASKVLDDLNQDNTKSKQLRPKKLTPVPVQTVFKKLLTTFVPKVDPLLSGLMHSQRKSCPQLNTSNLVYLKRLSKSSKHESFSNSKRTSQSSGKETSSNWRTVDSSAATQSSRNESTRFTGDVTDDLMTEDLIDTTADTQKRVTKMTDSTQEHTFGSLGTTDLIEGATADVMTEDLVTTYPTSCSVEIEVLRDAHDGSNAVKKIRKIQNQLVDDSDMKKVRNKVVARLVDFDCVCDRSDKPDYGYGTPELEEVDTFESLPSLPKVAVKVVEPKLCSTFLPNKKDNGAVLVDESTILRDDSHTITVKSISAEVESPCESKKVRKIVKATLTSTKLAGNKTDDGIVEDVSTISGDDCHSGIEGETTEFESVPVQKQTGKVLKHKLTSTKLAGRKSDSDVMVDVSTISGDNSHGFVCLENESPAIECLKSPAVPVKKMIGKAVKAKLTSTMLSGETTDDDLVLDMSTIHEEMGSKSLWRQAEKTPIQTTKTNTVTTKKLKKIKLRKEGKLQPKNSTLLFPREDGKQPIISSSNINCSAVVADTGDVQHGLQCDSNISLYKSGATDVSTSATKSNTNLKMHNMEMTISGNKSVQFSLPNESGHRRKKVFTSTPSNSKESVKDSSLIGLSSIAAETSYLNGGFPAHQSSREVITDEIIELTENTEKDITDNSGEISNAGKEETDKVTDIQYKAGKKMVDSYIINSKKLKNVKGTNEIRSCVTGERRPESYPSCCIEAYPDNIPQIPVQLLAYEAPSNEEILRTKPRDFLLDLFS